MATTTGGGARQKSDAHPVEGEGGGGLPEGGTCGAASVNREPTVKLERRHPGGPGGPDVARVAQPPRLCNSQESPPSPGYILTHPTALSRWVLLSPDPAGSRETRCLGRLVTSRDGGGTVRHGVGGVLLEKKKKKKKTPLLEGGSTCWLDVATGGGGGVGARLGEGAVQPLCGGDAGSDAGDQTERGRTQQVLSSRADSLHILERRTT